MHFFTVRFIGSISAAGGAAGLFQFPLLREGRRGKSCTTSSFLRFQFTLLREGRLPTVCHASPPKAFQFTPLREGRLDDVMNALKPILFQFTPLREGRHVSDEGVRVHFYFNSRPSARGDSCTSISSVLFTISIHAPPRGATSRMIFIGSLPLYFNSRPSARGDPVNVERKSFTPSHFNSRPSARGDVRVLVAAIIGAISIHAPPRGATLVFCSSFAFCPFQFTPLREGRPQKETSQRAVIISIHAPPRGATRPRACRAVRRTISIHAPPRGATFLLSVVRPSSTISIHAPPRGATQHSSWYGYYYAIISIHAPPRGATWKPQNLRK